MFIRNIALCNKGLNTNEVDGILKHIKENDVLLRKYYSMLSQRERDKGTFFSWSWFVIRTTLLLLEEYNLPHTHFEETLILNLKKNNNKTTPVLNFELV
ncbi:hypothetical protein [Spartinivicinus ruber]|uniref:hypothetical protein n=1 Tax=Spartinivicinus ruber TaxID=2683272 RepID=UPI0013D360CA|nr:hypothetical protein [Spartinivicinus ruber]